MYDSIINTSDIKVILLCGGKGERLQPLTEGIPKPLIKIKSEPILSYIIRSLKKHGIDKIIFATGYKAEKISEYLSENYENEDYLTVNSGDADIIKRIRDSSQHITGDFIVLYGDTITDVDIRELIKHHNSHRQPITITVWPIKIPYGLVDMNKDGTVNSFEEKPNIGHVNIGYIYIENSMVNFMKDYDSFENFLRNMAQNNMLNAYKHDGIHATVNTISELKQLEENIELFL